LSRRCWRDLVDRCGQTVCIFFSIFSDHRQILSTVVLLLLILNFNRDGFQMDIIRIDRFPWQIRSVRHVIISLPCVIRLPRCGVIWVPLRSRRRILMRGVWESLLHSIFIVHHI
jgi:hypothetical protein